MRSSYSCRNNRLRAQAPHPYDCAAAPGAAPTALTPLAWACAAFAGGVLLHVDRLPAWASAAALAIIAAVEEGVKASGNPRYRLVPDRREAIRAALAAAAAGPGWAVLVAGKGHEREQIVGDRKLPFSDVEEIGRALEELRG